MARIDTIRALIEEYGQIKAEMETFMTFENEENLLHATATIFIQLQRLPSEKMLAGGSPPSSATGEFQTLDKLGKCPRCGKDTKKGTSKMSGKPYEACWDCRIFISEKGKVTEMKQ